MIHTIGSIAVSGNTLTGTGTNFKAPLSMIRVGCTVIVKSDPIQIFSITEIVSDTELSVTPAASPDIPAGTAYSILLCDSISVDGLAQDVAETLRYYQGQETEIAAAIELLSSLSEDVDLESLSNILQNIQEETAESTANAQQTEANKEMTEAAAIRAEEAATSASGSASSASGSATSASTSASTATTKASEASTSATNAAASATSASDSAAAAALSEDAASDSADAASSSATSAETSATNAANSASSASANKDAAAASASAASTSEAKAKASETAAASSASSAATSASTATTKASEAAISASNASSSASNAAASAAEAQEYLNQMGDVAIDLTKVSGVLDVAHGGTGQSTEAGLKSYIEGLGIGTSSGTSIELPLSIDKGGTGATDAATARTKLGLGTGDHVQFDQVTVANGYSTFTSADWNSHHTDNVAKFRPVAGKTNAPASNTYGFGGIHVGWGGNCAVQFAGADAKFYARTIDNNIAKVWRRLLTTDDLSSDTWKAIGGGSIGKLNSVSLTANVSGTLPVANGGTGVTSLNELKAALGVTGSGSGGASSNDYELTEAASFDFQNPTTGRIFVGHGNMANFPTDDHLSTVVYAGSADEYIEAVATSSAKCIIECTKVTDSSGNVAYSMVVTRCAPTVTPAENTIARCYGYGVVSGGTITWAFRQDYW